MSKQKKHTLKWVKQTLELKEDHNWKSEPGTRIFVAGRGAVRFDVPENWHFQPQEKSFQFTDRKPPHDDCRLEASYNLLPPGEWAEFPLVPVLKKLVKEDERNPIEIGEVVKLNRQTARIVWSQMKFIDPIENREAYSRICIGLGSNVQCLITFDYWVDDAEKFTPVWDGVMNSLVLGLFIRDPRAGFALPD
ncbi:hypothetical protein H6G20_03190 [Desertifilum sp. FACHB-1129]|uniref:Uncharacterized protein n=1 Tax=Desertifilum tharense IPPAS B-1220 TaxID=1781255 RepID=A0A1E5QPU1_9CYAN|nr:MULTISPECIES: hypothetical protein [Desertifilum]MDA0209827.1 hypothetical protein [Cyanobacteria bacterium FC1]MBD2310683.1 hypothetical protein [Desertifilum sp. FACHB-1129]MBD2320720.1 hypothetical protein [Desertifilum sp. FACHB-866]MBD2330848.1 hypothetical protein [Desertifilum sp. FACHB-868]OEJ76607.1 hypothetical protein BH720_03355 [Desertifilum tharense IPPAS B-1220]